MKPGHALPALAVLLLGLGACTAASPGPAAAPDAPMTVESFDGPRLAREIFRETNRVRAQYGLPPLDPEAALDAAADEQTVHIALIGAVEHSNPVPGQHTAQDRVLRVGADPEAIAENAIMEPAVHPRGSTEPPYTYVGYAAFLVDAWMKSPGHRANILSPGVTEMGCAARLGRGPLRGDFRVYADQVFIRAREPGTVGPQRSVP